MKEERIIEIQEKTMKKKTDNELKIISSHQSSKKWEPEAIEAANRELLARIENKSSLKDEVLNLSSDDLLREQVMLLREIHQKLEITKYKSNQGDQARTRITDFDMPFGSLVVFFVKASIASIPAAIILLFIGSLISLLLGSCGLALGGF